MTNADWEGQPRGKGGKFAAGKMAKSETIEVCRQKASSAFENPTDRMMPVPYTRDAYNSLFPEGKAKTPLETVTLGAHQFERLECKDKGARKSLIGAMSQTLKTPSVVIGDTDDKGRPAKLYIKSYLRDKKIETTMAVVADIDGEHVSISFGRRKVSQVRKKIKLASIVYYTADGGGLTTGTDFSSSLPNTPILPLSPKKSTPSTNNFDGGNTMTTSTTTNRTVLAFMLKQRLATMTPTERGAHKRTKPPRWLYPAATEVLYARYYRAWIKPVKEYVHSYIAEHQEAILRGDSTQVVRTDAIPGLSFVAMINALTGWVAAQFGDKVDENGQISLGDKVLRSPVYLGLGDIAESAFNFNSKQWDNAVEYFLGIDFPSDESWWAVARDLWQKQNYDIIKSDIRKYIADINRLTEEAVTNGTGWKPLAKKIQALDISITKGRAAFIARDQIGKLNGQITQRRMESEGLTMYTWQTGGDERVRPSHALMDGKLCRWDDATVYSEDGGKTWIARPSKAVMLHPGYDYQCRCTALAYFKELLGEAGIEEEKPAEKENALETLDAFKALPDAERKAVLEDMAHVTKEQRELLAKYAQNMKADLHYKKCAYHAGGKIYLDVNKTDERSTVLGFKKDIRVFLHESGHWLDSNALGKDDKGNVIRIRDKLPDLRKKLRADVLTYCNGVVQLNEPLKSIKDLTSNRNVRNKMIGDLTDKDALKNGVSDIFEGLTRGKIYDSYGHGVSYWKGDALEAETIAHFFEARGAGGEKLAVLKKYFPSAYEYFEGYIKGAL